MQITTGLRDENKDFRGLTPREKEVLAAVVEGRTNQEIGFALGVSEKTVEKHIFAILQKLGVHTRVEAAVFAVREGWL
jgi:two-component system nitrate/nitrite response regulator NarL